tara:strand:- start:96 stop:422 length:327 start_codon:yes stop_codon:yes gene_type:complete
MANKYIHCINDELIDFTEEEITARKAQEAEAEAKNKDYKLAEIRNIRNQKLKDTDYLGVSDHTMSDAVKTWRTNLRNIPQDNTTENQYDTLLERKDDGSLKHSIWEKP